ncbi:MAG: non-homologous end-joining DNA ligase [Brumimicrobium sp.]|nr:non-homologous end-joining DNA ligase [Brumimicrobium sp.]
MEIEKVLNDEIVEKAEKSDFPDFNKPMLATLTEDYFDDSDWIYERKLDGERCLIHIRSEEVRLYSRNEQDLSNTYPEIVSALGDDDCPEMILDGEIVAFDGKVTSFSKLQNRMKIKDPDEAMNSEVDVFLYVFDIVYFDGYKLESLPLKSRKKLLKESLNWNDPIRFVTHRNENGKEYHEEACRKGWEGIIAKDSNSKYVHSRSKKWLKFKCAKGQELVIAGFTEPEGERVGFGALLVGYYEDDKLQYAGKVGTGYDDEFLEEWRSKFDEIERKTSPFENFDDDEGGSNHWIEPKYVGEFGFTEWTGDNKLRHPRFIGMRYDKDAEDVVKENPQ